MTKRTVLRKKDVCIMDKQWDAPGGGGGGGGGNGGADAFSIKKRSPSRDKSFRRLLRRR